MKKPDRATVSRLDALPNIGKVIARDLESIGIVRPEQLAGQDAFLLYRQLCEKKSARIDHCMIDVLMSVIDFMEGGEARPWWHFTEQRKAILQEREKGSA